MDRFTQVLSLNESLKNAESLKGQDLARYVQNIARIRLLFVCGFFFLLPWKRRIQPETLVLAACLLESHTRDESAFQLM